MTSPLRRTLGAVVDWLEDSDVSWYLFGAHALGVHALPRQTQDIDVTIAVESKALAPLIERLGPFDLRARSREPLAFAERYSVIPVAHVTTGITVDVIVAGTQWETRAMARVVQRDFLGRVIPVISAEDLLLGKLSSERERDVDDARVLMSVLGPDLDEAYIRAGLQERELAFDRSDLVSEFERLLERARRRR